MKQNIYDNPQFFEAYMEFRRTDAGFNAALEEPAMINLLPDLAGKRVLDIGCGTGRLTRYIAAHGARYVLGVDASERMLAIARSENGNFGEIIEYRREFIEDIDLPPGGFNLIVSSMALHYIEDLASLFGNMRRWLSDQGTLVFSVEHPVFAAGPRKWLRNGDGRSHWAVSDYFLEGRRTTNWLVEGVIKYHHTLDMLVNALLDCGFHVDRLVEPKPGQAILKQGGDVDGEQARPAFLLLRCTQGVGVSGEVEHA